MGMGRIWRAWFLRGLQDAWNRLPSHLHCRPINDTAVDKRKLKPGLFSALLAVMKLLLFRECCSRCRFQPEWNRFSTPSNFVNVTCRQCGSWSVAGHNHKKVIGRNFVLVSTTWALTCPETVRQRPCMMREVTRIRIVTWNKTLDQQIFLLDCSLSAEEAVSDKNKSDMFVWLHYTELSVTRRSSKTRESLPIA